MAWLSGTSRERARQICGEQSERVMRHGDKRGFGVKCTRNIQYVCGVVLSILNTSTILREGYSGYTPQGPGVHPSPVTIAELQRSKRIAEPSAVNRRRGAPDFFPFVPNCRGARCHLSAIAKNVDVGQNNPLELLPKILLRLVWSRGRA